MTISLAVGKENGIKKDLLRQFLQVKLQLILIFLGLDVSVEQKNACY